MVFHFVRAVRIRLELNEIVESLFHLLDLVSKSLLAPFIHVCDGAAETGNSPLLFLKRLLCLPLQALHSAQLLIHTCSCCLPPFGLWPPVCFTGEQGINTVTNLDFIMLFPVWQALFMFLFFGIFYVPFTSVPSARLCPRQFFSTSFRGTMIMWPQPMHFNLKSIPTRRTSHSLLPQG